MYGDNFDWMRDNAGTSTSRTGPRNDHTYGTANGNIFTFPYMFYSDII